MIRIAVITATRAEYGLMRQLLFALRNDSEIDLSLLVTGTHLSSSFGMTINEIIEDGLPIKGIFNALSEKNGKIDVAKTFSNTIVEFSRHFRENIYDYVLIDGDRYEIFAVAIAAVIAQIPVVHCSGGATTEGANDEYWRHAITKISSIHFPTTHKCKQRIIQMGEEPSLVYIVGSMGLENIRLMKYSSKHDIEEEIGMILDKPFALVTFHPVTLEHHTAETQIKELMEACAEVDDMKFIFTMANADEDGDVINEMIDEYVHNYSYKMACVASLGSQLYLSAMSYCSFVMGNSSSGIIEAPSFKIPTINIGDRQKGREQATSIINCAPNKESILSAIGIARNTEFRKVCLNTINPNGDGYTSEKIIRHLKEIHRSNVNIGVKHFYSMYD